ncbi:DNA-primase RepB domain-containing protein [Streptomyces virginiae]|uniref:DNA-primase RepB domain-containing protein n=1 Tax=Streptomyces virginiae TaxID=1961 RepID=UPI00378C8250
MYFCPALFGTGRNRRRENVLGSFCVWSDLDEPTTLECLLHSGGVLPSVVIESSPGKYHVYWLLSHLETDVQKLQRLNAAAAEALGADRSGFDAAQLLRLPFGVNSKPAANGHRPSIVYLDPEAVYNADWLLTRWPEPNAGSWSMPESEPELVSWDGSLPGLDELPTDVPGWVRERLTEGVAGDRSTAAYSVTLALAEQGADPNDIVGWLRQSPLFDHYGTVERLERDVSRIMAKHVPTRASSEASQRPLELPSDSWAAVPVKDILAGTFQPLQPSFMTCSGGGISLLYPGRSHSIAGESGGGKSLAAQAAAAQALSDGKRVCYVDYESDVNSVVRERLAETFRVSHSALIERFSYVAPDGRPSGGALSRLTGQRFDLVIIDGVTTALSQFGLSGRDEGEVTLWNQELVVPFERSGSSVLLIDHVTKSAESRGSYAIGSQAKRANLTGASYLARNIRPFGIGLCGILELKLAGKDRNGQIQRHADDRGVVARFLLDSTDPEQPVFRFESVAQPGQPAHMVSREEAWENAALEFIRTNPGSSKRAIVEAMGGGGKAAREQVLNLLEARGQVRRETEPHGLAHRYYLST